MAVLVFSLGAYYKRVEIDPDRRRISVKRSYCWIFQSAREYAFDDVVRVAYDCDSIPTSFSILGESTDELDMFRVSVELKSRELVRLWTFYGEGAVATGWKGVLLGDAITDVSGDQGDASLGYAMVLCAMLGKTLT